MAKRYRPVQVWIHWLMATMIAIVYVSMELITLYPKGSTGRTVMLSTHYLLGLMILIFALVRLWKSDPVDKAPTPGFQQLIARVVFSLLYGLMTIVPVLGWIDIGLWDVSVDVFGWQLPQIASPDHILAEAVSEVHIILAKTGYGLIALHASAALYHHFVVKDATLKRMLTFK